MWIVIYMAHNKAISEAIENLLREEDILFHMKPVYQNVTPEENCYEVLVPQSEAEEAHDILIENGY
ncbi:MAG: hypothetical protein GX375_01335 [Clostridiales bacterium]|nr:hypothetical protein [Clostridiales bacterium]